MTLDLTEEESATDLKARIDERIRFLKRITDFCRTTVVKQGTRSDCGGRGGPINGIYGLEDFGGFRFVAIFSNSIHIHVWQNGERLTEVLHMSWGGREDVEQAAVHTFKQSPEWANELIWVMDHWEQIVAEIDAKLTEAKKAKQAREQRDKELIELYETAHRLGVV